MCVFTYIRPCECHSVSKHQAKSWNDETKKLVYRRFETINQCAQTHLTASFPLAMHRQMMSATSCSSSWRCWRQRRNPPKFLFSCMEGQHSKQFENHPRDSKSHQNHAPKKLRLFKVGRLRRLRPSTGSSVLAARSAKHLGTAWSLRASKTPSLASIQAQSSGTCVVHIWYIWRLVWAGEFKEFPPLLGGFKQGLFQFLSIGWNATRIAPTCIQRPNNNTVSARFSSRRWQLQGRTKSTTLTSGVAVTCNRCSTPEQKMEKLWFQSS